MKQVGLCCIWGIPKEGKPVATGGAPYVCQFTPNQPAVVCVGDGDSGVIRHIITTHDNSPGGDWVLGPLAEGWTVGSDREGWKDV